MLLPLTNFTGISVACMVFELANILISLSASFIVIVLVNSEVIAIMLWCSLFLTIAFKVGWSVFWQRIKIIKLRSFQINYNTWQNTVQLHCNFPFIFLLGYDLLYSYTISYFSGKRFTYQSESTLHSCLNSKELLARSRPDIWSFKWQQRDSNPQPLSS